MRLRLDQYGGAKSFIAMQENNIYDIVDRGILIGAQLLMLGLGQYGKAYFFIVMYKSNICDYVRRMILIEGRF